MAAQFLIKEFLSYTNMIFTIKYYIIITDNLTLNLRTISKLNKGWNNIILAYHIIVSWKYKCKCLE